MKLKSIRRNALALLVGLALGLPFATRAGGNSGQMIARFEPAKSGEQINQLKEGDTVVKVCRSCQAATLVRVVKGGKGVYDVVTKKCEDCGSRETYVAIAKQPIPFKEQIKR